MNRYTVIVFLFFVGAVSFCVPGRGQNPPTTFNVGGNGPVRREANTLAQAPQDKTVAQLYREVEGYIANKMRELISQGKRIDAAQREDLEREKKSLAKKYAEGAAARPNLEDRDFYYLGRLYLIADNDAKALEAMKQFLVELSGNTTPCVLGQ